MLFFNFLTTESKFEKTINFLCLFLETIMIGCLVGWLGFILDQPLLVI